MDESSITLTYLIESSDGNLPKEVEQAFPLDEVSASSNFIGGVEVAVFLVQVAARPVRDIVKAILAFQAAKSGRYQQSKIVISADHVEVTGYGPEDIEHIMSLSMFQPREKADHET